MEKQLNLFDTVNEATNPACFLGDVMSPCPYCGRKNFQIIQREHNGTIYYSLTHDDYNLGWKKRKCGILLSDTVKEELIKWYNSMEWVKQHGA